MSNHRCKIFDFEGNRCILPIHHLGPHKMKDGTLWITTEDAEPKRKRKLEELEELEERLEELEEHVGSLARHLDNTLRIEAVFPDTTLLDPRWVPATDHKCRYMIPGVVINHTEFDWQVYSKDHNISMSVNFCPFCGAKLCEPEEI